MSRLPILGLFALLTLPGAASGACPVFTIERTPDGDVRIAREEIAEGGVLVFGRDPRAGTLDVVLPVGVGQSANLLGASDTGQIVVRFAGGRLSARARLADGRTMDLPSRALEDLRREDVRVCVTVEGRLRRAFLITAYDAVTPDTVGPVQNLFAGQVPAELLENAAVIQTDTWRHDPEFGACGRAPLERAGYLFLRGSRADGAQAWFVLDLAAGESVVSRAFVPAGQAIGELSMVEHSASGTRRLPHAPEGATGAIQTVAGSTTFPTLAFGGLRFANPTLTVLEGMPDVFGRPVAGILGMDLLRGCAHLILAPAAAGGSLELSDTPLPGTPAAETPFSWVNSHLVVRGALDGAPARWILDTGSPGTVVDSIGAPASLAPAGGAARPLRGLEGPGVAAVRRRASTLRLGGLAHRDVECHVSPLPVFRSLREPGMALGVLGLAEIARCKRLDVDFGRRVVRWFR